MDTTHAGPGHYRPGARGPWPSARGRAPVYVRAVAKPRVRILARRPVVVGEPCELTVEVTAEDEARVDFIDVRLEGRQGWAIGGGKNRVSAEASFPELAMRVMGAGTLAAGSTTAFDVRFTAPPGTAPSHEVSPAHARFQVRVHVSLPWRIDARYAFEVPVRLAAPRQVPRTPIIVRSSDSGPRVEVGLASSTLVAGEVVSGSVALFDLDERRHVDVAFVPLLRLYGRARPRRREGVPIRARVALSADHGGRAIPFRVQLPPDMTPGFETITHALAWQIEVSSDTLLGREVRVAHPLQVVDAAARARSGTLGEAPQVADAWIATLFAAVAVRAGWRFEPGDESTAPALVTELAHGEARVTHAYRDGETWLVVQLAHAPLGLGLTVVPGSSLRHLFWRDVEVGIDAWDRAHQVAARAPAQAQPFLAATVPALIEARELGTLVRWDDDALVCERAVTTLREEELMPVIARLEHLGRIVGDAREAIAPPADVAIELPAWRELARWLDGDLATGDLSLTGWLDGAAVEVAIERDEGRPARVRASVSDPAPSEAMRATTLHMPRPLADALAATVPEAVVECIATWPTSIVDLEVAHAVASASVGLPAAPPPVRPVPPVPIDARDVRALVLALRALVTALGPGASPPR